MAIDGLDESQLPFAEITNLSANGSCLYPWAASSSSCQAREVSAECYQGRQNSAGQYKLFVYSRSVQIVASDVECGVDVLVADGVVQRRLAQLA